MSHLQAQRQQQQLFNHQHNNGWQYAHPFAAHEAAFNAAAIPTNNAYNNVASTAQAWEDGMHQSFMSTNQQLSSYNLEKTKKHKQNMNCSQLRLETGNTSKPWWFRTSQTLGTMYS